MRTNTILATAAAAALLCGATISAATPKEQTFTRAELKSYFEIEGKLDPDKRGRYRQLIEMFPGQETFTASEVSALTSPKTMVPTVYAPGQVSQKGEPPRDTISAQEARAHFATIERRNPTQKHLYKALVKKYGQQEW
jgi:hypothetical protein